MKKILVLFCLLNLIINLNAGSRDWRFCCEWFENVCCCLNKNYEHAPAFHRINNQRIENPDCISTIGCGWMGWRC